MSSLEEAKKARKNYITGEYDKAINGIRVFDYSNSTTVNKGGGHTKINELRCLEDAMNLKGWATAPIQDDITGNYITMTSEEVQRLRREMSYFGCVSDSNKRTKHDLIDGALTEEAVNAIDW